jgi:hypothetical protein
MLATLARRANFVLRTYANPKLDPRLGHEKTHPPNGAFHEIPA